MGSRYQKKTKHISSDCARQLSSRKWVSLSLTAPHRSSSVFPGYFHLSDAPGAPITWTNDCVLIWGCLLALTENNSLESRKKGATVSDGNHGSWEAAGKDGLLTRVELLQLAHLLLDAQDKEVLQNVLQLLLAVQAQTPQVVIPQSEQRTAWRTRVHVGSKFHGEAGIIISPPGEPACDLYLIWRV